MRKKVCYFCEEPASKKGRLYNPYKDKCEFDPLCDSCYAEYHLDDEHEALVMKRYGSKNETQGGVGSTVRMILLWISGLLLGLYVGAHL